MEDLVPGLAHRWWGDYDLPLDAAPPGGSGARSAAARFKIGPLTVWVEHREHEWRFAWQRAEGEDEDDGVEVIVPADPASAPPGGTLQPPETATVERVAGRQTSAGLAVTPRLADRSIVSRPETRFRLAAGDEIELYVGTPLWARFAAGDSSSTLLEIPIVRPSDTWFGPSTLAGELCYANRTSARLRFEKLPPTPSHALTRVRLENHGDDDLLLERLNLPVPNLSLYAADDGYLWTESVTVERGEGGRLVEVRIDDRPPPEARVGEVLVEPRVRPEGNVFSRALGALLG